MKRLLFTLIVITACSVVLAQTDENIINVQNRLKVEGFYFGRPTGVLDSATRAALTRYQIRHGLTVSGKLDAPTANEFKGSSTKTQMTTRALSGSWRRLSSGEMQFVEESLPPAPSPPPAARSAVASASLAPAAPAEGPGASGSVAAGATPPTALRPADVKQPAGAASNADTAERESLRAFVEAFVQAGLDRPPGSEARFFAANVDYFGSPNVPREQIRRDLVRYNEKWPHRTFWIDGEVQVEQGSANEIKLLFPLRYELRNRGRHASGKVLKSLTLLKSDNNEMQIVAVNEWKAP